ncbi:hypothetical protein M3P21_17105 [Ruegeria sp. 2012CJ41-6]|uniref:Uncharacterized protein n=1 Tax=Ruegeria spongiae TaxID=2942209 RepID=A0ABT0Q5V0_9RHOB|nr:hypothetical protein [Ruegeria spongiae]MCL6285250.1 hypothetical protein [Ruegeria spongiae]
MARLSDDRLAYYVLDAEKGRLGAFVENGNGISRISSPTQFETKGGSSLQQVTVDGTSFVILAGGSGTAPGQVASYSVDPVTGALVVCNTLGAQDGLGLNTPTEMAAISVSGGGAGWWWAMRLPIRSVS